MWWRRRGPSDDEFRQEIEAHVAIETERLVAEGLSPKEATRNARRRFGNPTTAREDYREAWRFSWLLELSHDVRFSIRSLGRTPAFTAGAVLILIVGLGASTATFSLVNAVLLQPLPYGTPDNLVLVEHDGLAGSPHWATRAWRDQARSLSDFAGYEPPESATLATEAGPVQVDAARVTWNFLSLLSVTPSLGRGFVERDEAADSPVVVVLNHGFWQREFGGDDGVLGRVIRLTAESGPESAVVVGILGETFRYPSVGSTLATRLHLDTQPDVLRVVQDRPRRTPPWLPVIGRLAPQATAAVAATELGALFRQSVQGFTASRAERASPTVVPLRERIVGDAGRHLLLVMAAAGCVLLIVCANVAGMFLARLSTRRTEFAIRAALGAGTSRLVRMALAETLLLALMGSTGGLLTAWWSAELLRSMLADGVSYISVVPIDWWVLAFSVFLASTAGLMSGLAPMAALRSNRPIDALRREGQRTVTGRTGAWRALISVQVAATFILVVTASLFSQTIWHLHHTDRGFDGTSVLTAGVTPSMSGTIRAPQMSQFFADLTERVSALPGVESAAATSTPPLAGRSMGMSGISVVGEPPGRLPEDEPVGVVPVTPSYFDTIGATIRTGRGFLPSDTEHAERVAIVNDALHRRLAMDGQLVGRSITFGDSHLRVVGVVNDMPTSTLREPPPPFIYLPLAQLVGTNFMWFRLTVLARTSAGVEPGTLTPALRHTVWEAGRDIVIDNVITMSERLAATMRSERNSALLFGLLAAIGLMVAAAGVYGIVAFAVAERTREIGIRVALGARRRQVVGQMTGRALWPVTAGIAIGAVGAGAATRFIATLLFGTEPTDPLAFAATAVVLAGTALLAAWAPARRAARVDPVTALRAE